MMRLGLSGSQLKVRRRKVAGREDRELRRLLHGARRLLAALEAEEANQVHLATEPVALATGEEVRESSPSPWLSEPEPDPEPSARMARAVPPAVAQAPHWRSSRQPKELQRQALPTLRAVR